MTWEQLGPYRLAQQEDLPKVSRDSLLLAEFATLRRGDRVFDLGCGVGVLGLSLARRETGLTLDGADCQESCVKLARENLSRYGLAGSIWELSVATVLMYQAAWSALSIAVCALKQHN